MSAAVVILKDVIRRASIISIGERRVSVGPSDVKYVRSDSFNIKANDGSDGTISVGDGSSNPGFVEDDFNQIVSADFGPSQLDVFSDEHSENEKMSDRNGVVLIRPSEESVNGSPIITSQQTELNARYSEWITTGEYQPEMTATVLGNLQPCENSKSSDPQDKLSIRDYLMAISVFLITLMTYGNTNALSVWIIEWLDEYPQSASLILYIPNLSFALMSGFGFLDTFLINRFGIFNIMFLGCLLQTIIIIGSSFSANAITLIIVLGFFLGCTSCMAYMNAFIVMGIEFGDAGKSFITVLSLAGPLCGIIFPNLIPIFLHQYGWRGGMLILGGISLQMIPLSLFLLLSKKYKKKKKRMKEASKPQNVEFNPNTNPNSDAQEKNLDFSILRNPLYIAYVCMNLFSMSAANGFYSFLPAFLIKKGMQLKQAAFVYSIYCVLPAAPRVFVGVIQRWTNVPFILIFIGFGFAFGLMSILINFAETYSALFVCCVFLSLAMSCPVGLFNIGILECVGAEQYSFGTAISETIYGFGSAILGYLAGLLIVYMDSYLEAFSIYGGLTLLSNSFLLVTYLVKLSCKSKNNLSIP